MRRTKPWCGAFFHSAGRMTSIQNRRTSRRSPLSLRAEGVAISTAGVGCADRHINIENPGYTMLIGAFGTDPWCWRLPRPDGPRNDGGERWLVPFRRRRSGHPRQYRGTVITVPYIGVSISNSALSTKKTPPFRAEFLLYNVLSPRKLPYRPAWTCSSRARRRSPWGRACSARARRRPR